MTLRRLLALALPALGLVVLAAYLNFTVFGVPLSDRLELLLAFAIGPVAILGVMKIKEHLSALYDSHALRIATVFLIIAFSMFCLMIVVQQAVIANYRTQLANADTAVAKESLRQMFLLVNPVQLGIDVTFDIFYCIGLIALAIVLIGMDTKKKLLGLYGLVVGSGLLILNLLNFPAPPAESGMIDLGPATGIFWLILVISLYLDQRRRVSTAEQGDS